MQWRDLWSDHVYWTRFVVVAMVDGAPGLTRTVDRLMASCSEMRDLLRRYYGDAGAEAFGDLMTAHPSVAAQLLTEASKGAPEAAARTTMPTLRRSTRSSTGSSECLTRSRTRSSSSSSRASRRRRSSA